MGLKGDLLFYSLLRLQQVKLRRVAKMLENTSSKVIVFESDDWGFCGWARDKATEELFCDTHLGSFYAGDTLESENDLRSLFETLSSSNDSKGNSAVFSAYFVVANPDFDKLQKVNFSHYEAIPISSGFPTKWQSRGNLLSAWREGLSRKVFVPEYHGYCHFYYPLWLKKLQAGDEQFRSFFSKQLIFPIFSEYGLLGTNSFQSSEIQNQNVNRGFEIFRRTFDYSPRVVMCPNYYYNYDTVIALAQNGAQFLQHTSEPSSFLSPIYDLSLQRNQGITSNLFRNIKLEPGEPGDLDARLEEALNRTATLWKHHLPAIVETHRVNYVAGVRPSVASRGLGGLRSYLKELESEDGLVYLSAAELFEISKQGYSVAKYGNEFVLRNFRKTQVTITVCDGNHPTNANRSKISINPGQTVNFASKQLI